MTTKSITSGQEKQLVRFGADAMGTVLKKAGLSGEAAQRVIAQGGEFQERLIRAAEEAFRDLGNESAPAVPITYPVTVDYGKSLREMIAAGQYDFQNGDITAKHFPITGTGQVEVELHLVHLNRVVSTDTVLAELDRRNLRPATIAELLALGAKYPNLQKEFPVVALGSVWRDLLGYRRVAYLDDWRGERKLYLNWHDDDWYGHFRFLAVSK